LNVPNHALNYRNKEALGRLLFKTRKCGLLLIVAAFLSAETTPSWKTKPIGQWDNEDAKQVLADSPWAGRAILQTIRDRSPAERRDGGDWDAGVGQRFGLAQLEMFNASSMAEAIELVHFKPTPGTVPIRWESALPVSTAEAKLGESTASRLDKDWYAITLYDVPLSRSWGAVKLKRLAYLRRANKPDFKPSRVEILRHEDGKATITYLFSRSEEITRKDRSVIFVTQIDRLFVTQLFYPGTMQIEGHLEL
jgi:hypothetical protein